MMPTHVGFTWNPGRVTIGLWFMRDPFMVQIALPCCSVIICW